MGLTGERYDAGAEQAGFSPDQIDKSAHSARSAQFVLGE